MTKLNELLEISRQAATRWGEYEQLSVSTAHAMREGVAKFLGCPPSEVEFRPVLEKDGDSGRYAAIGAMHFGGDERCWHFGLVIPVGLHRIKFHFMMKQTPRKTFIVRAPYRGNDATFEIQNNDDFSEIGQWIFDSVKDYYDNQFDRFVAGGGEPVRIGFK